MASYGKKEPKKGVKKKVTAAEIARMQEERRKKAEEAKMNTKNEVSEEEYAKIVGRENKNRYLT